MSQARGVLDTVPAAPAAKAAFRRRPWLRLWLACWGYFFVLSCAFTFLFLPGLGLAASGNGGGAAGVLRICLAALACCAATALFLTGTPRMAFRGAPCRTFPEALRGLPGLAGALAVPIAAFAILSGLLAMLVFYALCAGMPVEARQAPVAACVTAMAVLTAPFLYRAFTLSARSGAGFLPLLSGSARMGWPLYLKHLGIGAAAYGLSMLIRLPAGQAAGTGWTLPVAILTSAALGAALLAAWAIDPEEGGAK